MTAIVVGGVYRVVKPRYATAEMNEGDICILIRDDYDGVPMFHSSEWSGVHYLSISRVEFLGVFV